MRIVLCHLLSARTCAFRYEIHWRASSRMDHPQIFPDTDLILTSLTTSRYSVLSSRPSFSLFGKMKAYSEGEGMALREKNKLTLADLENMESCPCNSRKDSSKYCENYAHMVKVYAKISQPDLFTPVEHVA